MPPVPSHSGNANVAEICNQVLMMLSHEIFDPEFGERVLIDQAFRVEAVLARRIGGWAGEGNVASEMSVERVLVLLFDGGSDRLA
jgi:hypothetical protein